MLEGFIGLIIGLLVAAGVGIYMKKTNADKLDAFLDLDWDMDGESGEIIAKVKAGKEELVEKIKEQIKKIEDR